MNNTIYHSLIFYTQIIRNQNQLNHGKSGLPGNLLKLCFNVKNIQLFNSLFHVLFQSLYHSVTLSTYVEKSQ